MADDSTNEPVEVAHSEEGQKAEARACDTKEADAPSPEMRPRSVESGTESGDRRKNPDHELKFSVVAQVVGVVGLLITAGSAYYSCRAVQEMKRTNELTAQSVALANTGTELTRQALIETAKQREIAEATLNRVRPYVWPSSFKFAHPNNPDPPNEPVKGEPIYVNVWFQNFGDAPAFNLRIDIHVFTGATAMKMATDFYAAAAGGVDSGSVLGPDKADVFFTGLTKSPEFAYPATRVPWDGKGPVLVCGTVSYKGTNAREWTSRFCVAYLLNGRAFQYVPNLNRID